MINTIGEIDRSLFLFLNGLHSPFWDVIMYQATRAVTWIPVYLFFLYLTIKYYKWQTIIIIISLAVMITFSDQMTNFFKESFERLRPSHEPGLQVHTVNLYQGGMYGFYSSHASNFFALATYLSILLKQISRLLKTAIFIWAAFVIYTRIYLGVHYPGDLITGMIIGACTGYFFGRITCVICLKSRIWFKMMD